MATHSTFLGFIFWLFFGPFGLHRLYFGKRRSGLAMALAFGVIAGGLVMRRYHFGIHIGTAELCVVGVWALLWLLDGLRIPTMRRQMSRRYQVGRYGYNVGWVLLVLLGALGAHRFYMRKWASGALYLLTFGLLGLGVLYDMVVLNELLSDANEAWISGPSVRDSIVG